jgi:general secretion pathway protein E
MRQRYTLDYLLKVLLKRGVLRQEQAEQVVLHQSGQRFKLEKEAGALVGRSTEEVSPAQLLGSFELPMASGGVLTEDRVMQLLAAEIGLPYLKIDPLKLDADLITSTLSLPYARKHRLLPIGRVGASLRVATDNPFNLEAFESLRSLTGGTVEVVLASKGDIQRCIREIYGFRKTLRAAEQDLGTGTDLGNLERLFKLKSFDEIEATDRHIVNAVDYLFHYALDQRASDIHIEPKRDQALVRLRIDGVLHTVNKIPDVVHKAMVSRIKTMARLDIAEKRRPQDGRIKMGRQDVEVELRVATLPVAFGEKLVIRIFDPMVLLQDLSQIGFEGEELTSFQSFVGRPNGLVLVTGPTGSGKTTTLYSALQILATEHVNVVTIEDPIEMVVEEFNQTAVQPKVGITFASALRTILRQDPDIVMVGEIRDAETAQQAIQAALTGHLVLSTLHTNDTASSVTRLVDLGVEPFLVASTLTGVLAQRLVRKVCDDCKTKGSLSPEQMMALGMPVPDDGPPPDLPVFYGQGCAACRHTGLYGRVGVFEVMPITRRIQRLIIGNESAAEIMKAARQDGMRTLREAAISKLAAGVTSFEEVLRVTSD